MGQIVWGKLVYWAKRGTRIQKAKPDAGMADDDVVEVPFPVVFQCRVCRAIVADSTSLSSSDVNQRTITFCRVTHLQPSTAITAEGGNSFHTLLCTQCDGVLGKLYVGTVRALDHARDLYTLDAGALTNYRIGTSIEDNLTTTGQSDILIADDPAADPTLTVEQFRSDMDKASYHPR
ncbi:hypothetical protein B5M09_012222 [Aphanomyces astaci]|uniref:Mis18 domain-containing protein n=1 Tax=Aphanomyces astaci TaxID=112090 RepID=A0A425C6B9_APHAT|nr:hypothetical protein B5M09_012222 [Aphanomyces astaci]